MIWLAIIFGIVFLIARKLADDSDKSQKQSYYRPYNKVSDDNRPFCDLEAWEQEDLDEATWCAIHCDKNYGKPYEEWE